MPRVLIARIMHETNTFSRVKTDMALIRRRDFHLENEITQAFRGTRSALGAIWGNRLFLCARTFALCDIFR